MKITDMHVMFRQYAQQMGLQNVRAILPEQIDIHINDAIITTVNELIRANIGVTNDRIITDNSKIGQINAFKNLYKVEEIDMLPTGCKLVCKLTNEALIYLKGDTNNAFRFEVLTIDENGNAVEIFASCGYNTDIFKLGFTPDYIDSALNAEYVNDGYDTHVYNSYASFRENGGIGSCYINTDYIECSTNNNITNNEVLLSLKVKPTNNTTFSLYKINNSAEEYGTVIQDREICVKRVDRVPFYFRASNANIGLIKSSQAYNFPDALFLVDFSINYKKVSLGYDRSGKNWKVDTIDPWISRYFPVRCIDDAYLSDALNDSILSPRLRSPILVIYNGDQYDLYFGEFKDVGNRYILDNGLLPNQFRISYIAQPAKVKFIEDLSGKNVDCDLPESMHGDIVKRAVDLYHTAISGNLYAAQQRQQNQQRETARNNADGNQAGVLVNDQQS